MLVNINIWLTFAIKIKESNSPGCPHVVKYAAEKSFAFWFPIIGFATVLFFALYGIRAAYSPEYESLVKLNNLHGYIGISFLVLSFILAIAGAKVVHALVAYLNPIWRQYKFKICGALFLMTVPLIARGIYIICLAWSNMSTINDMHYMKNRIIIFVCCDIIFDSVPFFAQISSLFFGDVKGHEMEMLSSQLCTHQTEVELRDFHSHATASNYLRFKTNKRKC